MKNEIIKAKDALDNLIKKSRVHLYKPIQIAEILYKHRIENNFNLLNLEEYRSKSKKWRDDISILLLGRKCTSTAKFQDNLFDENAIPPRILAILGAENERTNGAVEAYIYARFTNKHKQLADALSYCINATADNFNVKHFINSFWNEPGLKRSLDKIYEIVVYALFSTLVDALNLKIEISVAEESLPLLKEFEDFTTKILNIDKAKTSHIEDAAIYRLGVTNAADRGLDMYSNWGPAFQIKHLSLDLELAENIVSGVSSNKIVIVCKDAEKDIIVSLLTQIGWKERIQSIVTENDLIRWYDKALKGQYANCLANKLIETLVEEITLEFPSVGNIPTVLKAREYNKLTNDFWK